VPFYTSPSLLAPRLSDFSPEAGFPRVGYATTVDAYVDRPVTSGSWRRGVFDWLTLESHAEAGGGLINGGAPKKVLVTFLASPFRLAVK
jgi:outer membrane usher protein